MGARRLGDLGRTGVANLKRTFAVTTRELVGFTKVIEGLFFQVSF